MAINLGLSVTQLDSYVSKVLPGARSLQARRGRRSLQVDAVVSGNSPIEAAPPRSISPNRSRYSQDAGFWGSTRSWKNRMSGFFNHLVSRVGHNQLWQAIGNPTAMLTALTHSRLGAVSVPVPKQHLSSDDGSNQVPDFSSQRDDSPSSTGAALLDPFLSASDNMAVSYAAVLSDLCNSAYDITQLTSEQLQERHHLTLVSTSSSCPIGPIDRDMWSREVDAARRARSLDGQGAAETESVKDTMNDHSSEHPEMLTVNDSIVSLTMGSPNITPAGSMFNFDIGAAALARTVQASADPSVSQNTEPATTGLPLQSGAFTEQLEDQPVSPHAVTLTCNPSPPSAWFACDDPITKIRYFVIQGSTNFDHWQINIQFEPVIFEDPALGVRVHRGVYQAALQLYDDLLPLVQQHVATSPFASVSFAGHSLGGSLAVVLTLLFVHRGVVPASSVSPVYTFGAPAIFCGGASHDAPADRCKGCQLSCEVHERPADFPHACVKPKGLLQTMGLSEDHVMNIIMHKDIVPRAFVCDYTVVADLLKQMMPSFKDHSSLDASNNHKSLYNFIGRVAVVRPDDSSHFVMGDGHHPHLPDTPGLYKLQEPVPSLEVHSLDGSYDLLSGPPSLTILPHDTDRPSLRDATLKFMNYPHPLSMLSDYNSYGPNGAISRYHNPDNYTKGLLVLAAKQQEQQEAARAAAAAESAAAQPSEALPTATKIRQYFRRYNRGGSQAMAGTATPHGVRRKPQGVTTAVTRSEGAEAAHPGMQ